MAPSPRPQDLVFTLFGDHLLHRPEPVWVGGLIRMLAPLGLSAPASRTVLSRMSGKGWLEPARGRRGYYTLSRRGRQLLQEGEQRIYQPPRRDRWDGWWQLVTYSIPEERRELRDRLRVRLQWLGFGQLGHGLWLSPHRVDAQVSAVADALNVTEYLELFRARHLGFASEDELVARCWDLPGINARYRAFIDQYAPAYARARERLQRGRVSPRSAFVNRLRLVHAYRRFPLIDPYLPEPLLPKGWRGLEAAELFQQYHDLLTEPAETFVSAALEPVSSSS